MPTQSPLQERIPEACEKLATALEFMLLSALMAWWISKRVITRQVAELESRHELVAERSRIARDMHDAVGSQLTQLAVMHDIVADELALSDESREKLGSLSRAARASVAALDAVVWTVNPGNDNPSTCPRPRRWRIRRRRLSRRVRSRC